MRALGSFTDDAYYVTMAAFEAETGINFLPGLEQTDPSRAQVVEQFTADDLWDQPPSWPGRLDSGC